MPLQSITEHTVATLVFNINSLCQFNKLFKVKLNLDLFYDSFGSVGIAGIKSKMAVLSNCLGAFAGK